MIMVDKVSANHARIVLSPFERGFGQTLGNALRRILLSSLPGCAVTEVEIEGVSHEYSSKEGLREDVIDLILNIKDMSIKMHGCDDADLALRKQGPGVVTAGDISSLHNIEIVNPNHVLAHLNDGGQLNMKLHVSRGRGYQPASKDTTIGRITLDATFSPVRRVYYAVESALSEQRPDLYKLVIDIETNGTINPEEAVSYSAKILHSQLGALIQGIHNASSE